ncbi:MAG TPA: hypothetical protein PLL00_04710 [Bacteroidia bacterium]|nr:hypothetical protein [Bacteroidia bacterium]
MRKVVIFFLFCTSTLFASTKDSSKVAKKVFPLKYYTANQFEYSDSANYVFDKFQDFHNFLGKNTLGNIGMANDDFRYKASRVFGFNYGKNNYEKYYYTPYNLKFYDTRIPYADLFYVFGTKQEQYFKMAFSYNIKKNWNVTVNFSRIRSKGFYQNLVPNHTFFAVSSNYKTLNNRYMLLASVCFNTIKNTENGGLKADTMLFNGEISNAKFELANAKNYRRNRNAFVKQYFNLGHRENDSVPIIPSSRFILTTEFDEMAQTYDDINPLLPFYPAIYYDSTKTFDSSHIYKLNNELTWKRVDNKKHRGVMDMIGVGASIQHQLVEVKQREIYKTINNIFAGAELNNLYSKHKLWWKAQYRYGLSGYNKDDYEIYGILSKGVIDSLSSISLSYKSTAYAPDFMFNQYSSNHFKWENNFDKVSEQSITAGISIPKYDLFLSADYTSYKNLLFFDLQSLARQYDTTFNMFSVQLKKNISFFNWHLNNTVIYQNVPNYSVIPAPEWILQHSLFYENDLFKKALRMQIGFELFYNSAFYSNAYMPVLGEFYIQSQRMYGGYPMVDFFLNMKIKIVNAFFKIEHLNSGFSGNNYMLTPHYAMAPRTFKFGVSWKLFN